MAFTCKLIECYPGFGPDLVINGNMEDGNPPANWSDGGGAAVAVGATVRNGCQSLEVTDGGAGGGYANQTVTVEAGHKYKIDVWGYSSAAGDTWRVRIYVGANVVWTSATHDVTAPVAWEKETKFYRVPTGVTAIVLRLEVVGLAKVLYFDDVSVSREAPVPMTHIDLFYSADAGWAMLEKGLEPNDPERRELWGGYLEDQLMRQEDGKRVIPLKLQGRWASPDTLIDAVNALEEMLRHAARFRKDGWGGECFLEFQLHTATHPIWYPVCSGSINKNDLMNVCGSMMESGHRVTKALVEVGVTLVCEAYWESPYTYDLSNLLDNPGFEEWNAGICDSEPDCWDDYSTAAGAGDNNQETDTVEEGCEALRIEMRTGVGAGVYQGVTQDITARLRADTEYTLLAWVQNTDVFVNCVAQVYAEGQNSGITYALNSNVAHAGYTIVSCQFTPNATDIANWVEIRVRILTNDVNATGLIHIDKMLVMEASNVPTGWKSSDYLVNHYDTDAGHINYLSVCDVPGEVEAEIKATVELADDTRYLRVAKRTRDTPCCFVWELNADTAYTTADAHYGLTDATCIDSLKEGDGTSPVAHRISVTFAGDPTMQQRCYWDITSNLTSYYGPFVVFVIAKATGTTDTINMEIKFADDPFWNEIGGTIEQRIAATSWTLYDGWEVLSFRVGTHDNDLFGVGNNCRLMLRAETNGTTDDLYIAGAYWVPIGEALLAAGSDGGIFGGGTSQMIIKDMDGDLGVFGYGSATDTHYANLGSVGGHPLVEPRVENWWYLVTTGNDDGWVFDDAYSVALQYRPRGIFLRGSNP